MATVPLFEGSILWRVVGPSLDPRKNWYILHKEICGMRPSVFVQNEIFKRFEDEIGIVPAREILPAKSSSLAKFERMPSTLYVASSFGLFAGLLRRKEIRPDSLVCSPMFDQVVKMLNLVALDAKRDDILEDFGSGDNFRELALKAELEKANTKIVVLEQELTSLQARIDDLQSDMENSFASTSSSEADTSSCCSSPLCCPSSPCSSCSSISETRDSPDIGKTTKKRMVQEKCRKVRASLSDVAEKYRESIGCVLGNSFIFGEEDEKQQVRDVLSEIVDIVMDAKGKRGFSELFSSEAHNRIFKSMRVPDWVLLYFKLQARLPDSAWQTLLNLTHLGKSRVSD